MSRADLVRLAIAIATAAALVACDQPLLKDQPRYDPLEKSEFFEDGRSARPIPAGTVSRERFYDDAHLAQGTVAGQPAETFPFEISTGDLERGRDRFNIFCSPCHGRLGNGRGTAVRRGLRAPPSFHIERLRDAPVGHLYQVISEGIGIMPSYAMQLTPPDRWRVVGYIRALQLSQRAPFDVVPQPESARLLEEPNR